MSLALILTYGVLGFFAAVGAAFLLVRLLQETVLRGPAEKVRMIAVVPVSQGEGGRIADEIWRYRFFFDQREISDGFVLLVGEELDEESLQCCRILSEQYPWIGYCSAEEYQKMFAALF
ncbi:MAG: hypothetical protein HFE44_00410 [Oscillospiraceae bacterium]|nr:hypothetical protein [Oscillospiraceae bacterium]